MLRAAAGLRSDFAPSSADTSSCRLWPPSQSAPGPATATPVGLRRLALPRPSQNCHCGDACPVSRVAHVVSGGFSCVAHVCLPFFFSWHRSACCTSSSDLGSIFCGRDHLCCFSPVCSWNGLWPTYWQPGFVAQTPRQTTQASDPSASAGIEKGDLRLPSPCAMLTCRSNMLGRTDIHACTCDVCLYNSYIYACMHVMLCMCAPNNFRSRTHPRKPYGLLTLPWTWHSEST